MLYVIENAVIFTGVVVSANLGWLLAWLKVFGMAPLATLERNGRGEMVGKMQKESLLLTVLPS